MTGAQHYREAEQLLNQVKNRDVLAAEIAAYAAVAQVHATLALAAAVIAASQQVMKPSDLDPWQDAFGVLPTRAPRLGPSGEMTQS